MKILVFTTLYPNAVQVNHGIFVEKRLLELRKRFDIEARVVAPVPWYPRWLAKRKNLPEYHKIPAAEHRNGVHIVHPRYPVIPGVSWRFAPALLNIFCRSCVSRIKKDFRFALIDAHFAFPDGVAATSIAKALDVPCIVTARGSDVNDSPKYLLPRWFIRAAFKHVGKYIAVSRRLKAELLRLGLEENKLEVLPNGVDTLVFQPREIDATMNLDVSKPYLLTVGSLRELKGHHLVIRALAENPNLKQYSLIIAGAGGMQAKLENLVKELGVEQRVQLIGEVPNNILPALYSGAAAFVLASSNEGCPNVVLEALACGTRVVASDVGGVPDLLPAVLHDFMFKDRDAATIGRTIVECLNAEIPADSIREHAKSLNWDATCQSLYEVMKAQIESTTEVTR